jgi:Fungal specific transcription factor domain
MGVSTGFLSLSPTLDTSILQGAGINAETVQMSSPAGGFSVELLMPVGSPEQLVLAPPPPAQLPMDTSTQGLVNAFYIFFFPAHPFVLPYDAMQEMFRKIPMNHLQIALQYIGSFYVVGVEKNMFEATLSHLFTTYTGQKDHWYVQALALFAVGLHMADKEHDSTRIMHSAINIAKEIGMHTRHYATSNGGVNTLLEECLRRTWWELFVLDGMMTGVNPEYSMQLGGVDVSDIPLPNEECEYFLGVSKKYRY